MNDEQDETGAAGGPEEQPQSAPRHLCPVVGIGASAGGLEALKRLLPGIDPQCGMAFVIIQHLDPEHTSALAAILAGSTSLAVSQATSETEVEPGHIYIIPPNATLSIHRGRLRLARPAAARGYRNPIDEFFTSLAGDQGENAACIILSGTGSDGTIGLRAIKEHGGLTLAQAGAEYDGMMRSAVATGLVDFVLPVEEMPKKLAAYFRQVTQAGNGRADAAQADPTEYLGQITNLLRVQTGHDFGNYKHRTIVRRIQRRMHVLQIESVPAFIERLRSDPHEVNLLFQDLLIGVTSFFREPEAFAALEREVLPNLFKGKGAEDTIRVWVPGCATGEEAYSIAILLREYAPKSGNAPKLQVFATDIDEHSLSTARVGRYSATILKDVSEQRLERYFLREDGTYRIASDLREICLFSPHNLLRDAPFSKLDLISCRNLLIYFSADLQDRVIPLFHYALAPSGYLFLGPSENVTRHSRLFFTVDKTHRIFRRRALLEKRIPEFPLTTPHSTHRPVHAAPPIATSAADLNLRAVAERQVLDRFSPAYAVINAEGDLLHSSGRTGKYIELPPGTPNTNIFNMARPGLRLELRAALHRAASSERAVVQSQVVIGTNGGRQEIDLHVLPLRFGAPQETYFMVLFQDVGGIKQASDQESTPGGETEEASVRHLESELRATKERLQTVTEELESSNEELKSGNEELQSMNEELQSANEELETSREELQSINEELQTVNAELNARVDELSRANNDMNNLLESTQIATVFLDRNLLVKGFTPAAKDVFRLVESDSGRPISHVRARIDFDGFQEEAARVLRTLTTIERPVTSSENGTRYMMRLLPYRTAENVINGVVMTFTDITRIEKAEARVEELTHDLQARISELETVLDLVPVGVMLAGMDGTPGIVVNAAGGRLLGLKDQARGLRPASAAFRLLDDKGAVTPMNQPLQKAARTGEAVTNWQGRLENDRGETVHVMISATPLFKENGAVRGAVAAIVDISPHKQAEAQQRFLLSELQHRVKNILATIGSLVTRMPHDRGSVAEFRDSFAARINAMGRTHELLSEGAWSGASLRALAELALAPYTGSARDSVRIEGAEMTVPAAIASTLGLILHELATNAAKYGALSTERGTVELSWHEVAAQGAEPRLHLTWTEQGGPTVEPAHGRGFGTRFIRRAVTYELAGTADLQLNPDGLRCEIEFPLPGESSPS